MTVARLHPGDVDAIARRVADLLVPMAAPAIGEVAARVADLMAPESPAPRRRSGLVSSAEAAAILGRGQPWVRAHAVELGGVKLTGGEKPRWAFDPDRLVSIASTARDGKRSQRSRSVPRRTRPAGRSDRTPNGHPLLPLCPEEA